MYDLWSGVLSSFMSVDDTVHVPPHPPPSHSALTPPPEKITLHSVNEKSTAECPFADTALVINAFLIVIRNTLEFMARLELQNKPRTRG